MENIIVQFNQRSQFIGSFPEVQIPTTVNVQELIKNNPNPTFLTLPIMSIGSVAQGGMIFDRPTVQGIVDILNATVLEGSFGHENQLAKMSVDFPQSSVFWLGSVLDDNGTAWAKGYIWNAEDAEYIRVLKQLKKWVETSFIMGVDYDNLEYVTETDWRIRDPHKIQLVSMDLTPEHRAALQFEGRGDMIVTKQSKSEEGSNEVTEIMELKDIPAELFDAIITQYEAKNQNVKTISNLQRQLTEIQQQVETQTVRIAELERTNHSQVAELHELLIKQAIDDAVKVDSPALKKYVVAQLRGLGLSSNKEAAVKLVQSVVESEEYLELAKAITLQLGGGVAPESSTIQSTVKAIDPAAAIKNAQGKGVVIYG